MGTMPKATQDFRELPAPTRNLLALEGSLEAPLSVLGWAHRLHRLLALTCF